MMFLLPHRAPVDQSVGVFTGSRSIGARTFWDDILRPVKRLLILGGLTAIAPVSIDMYLPALPQLEDDLAAGASLTQLTVTSCLIGLAVGQVVTGPISDRWGRRAPLVACMALYAVASVACAVAPTVEVLVGARLVQGLTGSAGVVIARAVVRDLYEGALAARYFSWLLSVSALAPVLAPLVGGQLLHVTTWRGILGVLAGLGALLVAAVLIGLPETLPAHERRRGGVRDTGRVFRQLLRDRHYVAYALCGGFAFAAMFAYIAGSPLVLQDAYGLSPQAFSFAFAANGLGIVAAGQLSGRLAGRASPRRLLAAGLAISLTGATALLAAVLAGAGLVAVLPSLFLVVGSLGLIMPNSSALAMSSWPPAVAGRASALLGLLQFVIGGAVSPLVGVAGSDTAVPMAIVIATLSSAAVLAYAATRAPAQSVGEIVDKLV
jgi:DHA1 family bicyclomycin/chloramphenicol resistance-like MFS transporter